VQVLDACRVLPERFFEPAIDIDVGTLLADFEPLYRLLRLLTRADQRESSRARTNGQLRGSAQSSAAG
jgi:hypothetical protein